LCRQPSTATTFAIITIALKKASDLKVFQVEILFDDVPINAEDDFVETVMTMLGMQNTLLGSIFTAAGAIFHLRELQPNRE
jgi:hypothetical protein